MLYAVRVDASSQHEVFTYLIKKADWAIFNTENVSGENIHTHLVIETKWCEQTIRQGIRKYLGAGNKNYSMSVVKDMVKAVAYVIKDIRPNEIKNILEVHTYKNELIEFDLDDLVNTAMSYDLKVKDDMKSKKTRNVLEGILSTIDPRYLGPSIYAYGDHIKNAIVQYHLDNELLIRKFQIRTYYDTIVCRYNPRHGLSLFD